MFHHTQKLVLYLLLLLNQLFESLLQLNQFYQSLLEDFLLMSN